MKLLLDQNISRKLVKELNTFFPGSNHVCLVGLEQATDEEVWNFALENNYIIVTQDSDFYERSIVYGYPPKVIWLRSGNISTIYIKNLLKKYIQEIVKFGKDKALGCLQIY